MTQFDRKCRFFVSEIKAEQFPILALILSRRHFKVFQPNRFPVAYQNQIIDAVSVPKKVAHIVVLVNPFSVDFHKTVADLQGIRTLIRATVKKTVNRRRKKRSCSQIQEENDQNPKQKIVEGTRTENQQTFPDILGSKCSRIFRIAVLALHRAVSAQWYSAQSIKSFPSLPFPNSRSHAHGEFIDFHPAKLGRKEVPELVHCNQHAENQDSE